MQRSVVLCSGGLNSAVLLALAREASPVLVVHARYEHPAAERESRMLSKLVSQLDRTECVVIDLPRAAGFRRAPGATTETSPAAGRPADAPLPGLMTSLLGIGCVVAASINAPKLWVGLCEAGATPGGDDADPEQSREYAQLMEHALALATPDAPLSIEAPLIDLPRGDVVKLARRLEVPLKHTWSCRVSGDTPCQACRGCRQRARAFLDATIADPVLAHALNG